MLFDFDPSAIRAELKTEGDHWVVAIEMGTGRWSHAETVGDTNSSRVMRSVTPSAMTAS